MRIQSIEAYNFKSLVEFKLDLVHFNCLIGLNGSGKSTVLQFIDFLSQLVRGDMKGWLRERKWNPLDLRSKLTKKPSIEFCVGFCDDNGEPAGRWEATYSPKGNRCTKERIDLLDFLVEAGRDTVEVTDRANGKGRPYEIAFEYEGSILSALKEELLPASVLDCKKFLHDVKSLDLLDPEHLRQRNRESSGTLGIGGQNLSAFLHEMGEQKRLDLIAQLKMAYPQLEGLHAKSLRSGWKRIEISETYKAAEAGFFPRLVTEDRHVNDGMLRLMAILAELQTKDRFVLFDEIENGINPELVEFVIDRLVGASQQVLVTTHSPMILNYLDDAIARAGVTYLYKTPLGHTKAIPFFSIPSLAEKLTVMGPGEAFVDTNLTGLAEEIAGLTAEDA
jgi:ABC-type multidrug transport system ATPase subunit